MGTVRIFNAQDIKDIHDLLTSNRWEYFVDPVITAEGLNLRNVEYFSGKNSKSLVYRNAQSELLGVIRFFEIEDNDTSSPDFTIYVDEQARQNGVGKKLLKEGVQFIFDTYKNIRRVEATTRCDNIPMQRLFVAVGFSKESHYRKEWKVSNTGEFMDAFGYAILRDEFLNNEI